MLRIPVDVDGHDLARLDLAEEGRADDVERAGLARDDVPGATRRVDLAEATKAQRTDAERIARGDQRILRQEHEAVRTLDARQRLRERMLERVGARLCEQRPDHLGVTGRLELDAFRGKLVAQLRRVDEVAVVPDHHRPDVGMFHAHRLCVAQLRAAGRAVARVADRYVALEFVDRLLVEHLRDETHLLADTDLVPIAHRDTGGLLSAMLE